MNYTDNMSVLLQEFKYTQGWLKTAPGITNFQALIMACEHWKAKTQDRDTHSKQQVSSVALS